MAILNYIIWNGSPEIFTLGSFPLRWYGLLFALAFLITQQILYYIYKQEGKPERDVDTLTIYMVIATIIGARLGHVIFYQPELILENPLGIFLPFKLHPFEFTGLQGLASHGAAIGILFALWLYSRKNKPGQSYFQVVDRIVILVALAGALIRLGNYFNSEIIGLPTEKPWSVVFVNRFTEAITSRHSDPEGIIDNVAYKGNDSLPKGANGRVPINIYIFFKKGASPTAAQNITDITARGLLNNSLYEYFDATGVNTTTQMSKLPDGTLSARIQTFGIARHPAQLYESIACVILFLFLLWLWSLYKEKLPPGRLLGIFLIWCFGLRFVFEYLKENQEAFENELPLNMGQILSIPLVIVGIIILVWSFRKKEA
ncbi:prolipoprotein diacylglyceryl transferase [Chryseolinea lacunae]|uniref:Phosphatidylglycerol--prolipoprotein diacylglyceryl transferase n=1 Tax=Chryseolinea lacunae TaxID=2801331 RepID=A0ABS1KQ20_9BACT|nr:prolipoprotein diacylglyceryl transferase [Chryseolinea lacunae]MBL0741332.1 prolipoprotein diacylglyceryl transferase [Chryseolinea lacunae]